jgi:hypothetical protein
MTNKESKGHASEMVDWNSVGAAAFLRIQKLVREKSQK